MLRNRVTRWLVLSALGGVPLITSVTCDPATGTFDFFRDDGDFDDYYYDDCCYDVYYDDCFFFGCF